MEALAVAMQKLFFVPYKMVQPKVVKPLFSGKEFEILIDSHGPDHVTQLMQKVISALEHLESLSSEKEGENHLVDTLKTTITRLELEDLKRSEERHRHDRVRCFHVTVNNGIWRTSKQTSVNNSTPLRYSKNI